MNLTNQWHHIIAHPAKTKLEIEKAVLKNCVDDDEKLHTQNRISDLNQINIENLKRIGFEDFRNTGEYYFRLNEDYGLWYFEDDEYFELVENKVYFNSISEIEQWISHLRKPTKL